MIGKVLRGQRPRGLLYYLFGTGRREEHTDPHIVAGWRDAAELEPPLRPDGRRDFRQLAGLLNQPHAALGPRGLRQPVWHCVVRAAPGDRLLSDHEWAELARDIMHRTGLAPHGQDDDAVRWIAVRHAADHVHIVGTLARQDGARPKFWNDYFRVRDACQAAEERHGLRRTAPGDRTAGHRPTRAESEKARRHGRPEAPRVTLRRIVSTAAAGAASEEEFFTHLRKAGVLVRTRISTRDPGQVTGYAVALDGDTARAGGPVWFGGGKLAADLTLPKLRCRWGTGRAGTLRGVDLTAGERNAIWLHAARTAQNAREQIRAAAAVRDLGSVTDAAWAASDTLHSAAAVLGSRVVRQAADSYARAARILYARMPRPTPAGNSLRQAARLLSRAALVNPTAAQADLIVRLAALAEAVVELRQAQQLADDVDDWLDGLTTKLATRSLQGVHAILKRAIRQAQARDRVLRNVAELVTTPKGKPGRPSKAMTLEQATAMLDQAKASRLHAYVVVSLLTGIRTEEARALRWSHVVAWDHDTAGWRPITEAGFDHERFAIYVWRSVRANGDTKTEKSRRTLELPGQAADALREHRARQAEERLAAGPLWRDHGLVFASQAGTPLDASHVRRSFKSITRKAGLGENWTPRELPHSFVSIMSDNGVPIETIADLVGHASTAVTEEVYRHQLKPVITKGAEMMNTIFNQQNQAKSA